MKYSVLGRTGLTVSRLGFGTAEIGFRYGLGNRPVPSETEAISLLQKAVDLGIIFFDTAGGYGLAEERIGKSGILKNTDVIVETKCAQFLEKGEYPGPEELEKRIRTQVRESLTQLCLEALPLLVLHGPSAEEINKGELITILEKLKKEGLVRYIGVSTRGDEAPIAAIHSGAFDVIQVAYSLLDQRMSVDVFPLAAKKDIGIVNRSVLLKGALTPLREKLPAGLELLQSRANEALHIAQSLGTDLPSLAIRFAAWNPHIATALIGSNKITNLEKAIQALEQGDIPGDVRLALEKLAIADPKQVDPAKWPKPNK